MRIDLTGSEQTCIEANYCPGALSVLSRQVEGVTTGELRQVDEQNTLIRNIRVMRENSVTILESRVERHPPWHGVFSVDTAELVSRETWQARRLTVSVEVKEEQGTLGWTLLLAVTDPEGKHTIEPTLFRCSEVATPPPPPTEEPNQ